MIWQQLLPSNSTIKVWDYVKLIHDDPNFIVKNSAAKIWGLHKGRWYFLRLPLAASEGINNVEGSITSQGQSVYQ